MARASRNPVEPSPAGARQGSPGEVFGVFLKLGVTSFGGPIAHLGYFRDELVTRRRWIDDAGYADLVALAQFLPGPASNQVGFALGVIRGNGLVGGLAAWAAFTLPSALLLLIAALGLAAVAGPAGDGLVHGLKLVAVAVIAQALWGMAGTLTPDRARAAIALAAVAIVAVLAGSLGQVAAIAVGAFAGLIACRDGELAPSRHPAVPASRRGGAAALVAFAVLLVGVPVVATVTGDQGLTLFDAFYRSGALVFGGGHVVLPLLATRVVDPGWVTEEAFLAGYGLTQAVPGPLFTFAAYLGAVMAPAPNGLAGAALALVAVFLPGLLLVYGALPFWAALRAHPLAAAAARGANAAVVGILAAALYDPVWTGAVLTPVDFALALAGFSALVVWRAPPWVVVGLLAGAGVVSAVV